ncbi:MAG: hypothetical protein JWR32_1695 [Mycobacterium sp.]|nr:hypothetical protein [Mycobacterium sp.]
MTHTVLMDETSGQPKQPHEDLMHRAEHLAEHAGQRLPSWLRPGNPEGRWPVLLALVAAIAMQRAIPQRYTVVPRWPLIALEVALLLVLLIINPVRFSRPTQLGRAASVVLLAAITADNTASAILLDYHIVTGKVSNDAAMLLGSGAAIFITNIIVFGIWYWELDRGGPFARAGLKRTRKRVHPDFMFPQMANPALARKDWRPTFVDYLYVSVTNVMAFSPTDTMPLARWAKGLMTLQALVAVSTLALVIARAVNVLK